MLYSITLIHFFTKGREGSQRHGGNLNPVGVLKASVRMTPTGLDMAGESSALLFTCHWAKINPKFHSERLFEDCFGFAVAKMECLIQKRNCIKYVKLKTAC